LLCILKSCLGDEMIIISDKTTLGLSPRHEWLKNRTKDVVNALLQLEKIEDWDTYRKTALDLSKELNYACVEWGRYCNDNK
jgi:hypothetical protein